MQLMQLSRLSRAKYKMLFEYNIEDVKAIQWSLKTNDPWYGTINNFSNEVPIIYKNHSNLLSRTYDFDTLNPVYLKGDLKLENVTYDKIRTKIRLVQSHISDLKSNRLKPFLNFRTGFRCCYCARDHIDEASLDLDIEHILPKLIFNDCYFDLENLSISCKRCNMGIKKNDYSFLVLDLFDLGKLLNPKYKTYIKRSEVTHNYVSKKQYFNTSLYSFIHPNLDNYDEHIDCTRIDFKGHRYTTYITLTDKGRYTYNYFRLKDFEVNSFKTVQGIERDEMKAKLLDLFENILGVD